MGTKDTFGVVPSLFWDSDTGRAIQARGKDALILSLYLRANRHDTMLGLYYVRVDQVLYELPVLESPERVRAAFIGLREAGFAEYDERAGVVWVRTMALERIRIKAGDTAIDPEDSRIKAAQRLFELLPPSPLLDEFFKAYGTMFRLTRRSFGQPTFDAVGDEGVLPLDVPPQGAPPQGAPPHGVTPLDDAARSVVTSDPSPPGESDPAAKGRTVDGASTVRPRTVDGASGGTGTYVSFIDQSINTRQGSNRTAASPPLPLTGLSPRRLDASTQPNGTNYGVIARVARELLRSPDTVKKYFEIPIETEGDLVEAVKCFCRAKRIDYGRHEQVPYDTVHRACCSEWIKFRNPGLGRRETNGGDDT